MNEQDVSRVASVVGHQILRALETKEAGLDEEIRQLEKADNDDLAQIRARRLRELKRRADEKEHWKQMGHGTYEEIDEKEFFSVAKQSRYVVSYGL